jgi:triosephosphate isomerase
MRKQIAAANWKMNLTYQQGEKLLDEILKAGFDLKEHQYALFAVPFPYLLMTRSEVEEEFSSHFAAAAQNCHHKKSGAFTGEVSAEMLHSMNINYCVVGHSERREYNGETNSILAEKVNACLDNFITPVFCCGEPLSTGNLNTKRLRSRPA